MAERPEPKDTEIFWNYTPPDFFEEPFRLDLGEYSFDIADGRASTWVSTDHYISHPNLRETLTGRLEDSFLWAQPYCREHFIIAGGGINHLPLSGPRRGMIRYSNFGLIVVAPEAPDIEERSSRLAGMKRLAQLSFAQATDRTARRILKSYSNSMIHPENEMVYLYEIWETLKEEFRREPEKFRSLGLGEKAGRFIELTCNREIKQSRHRGRHDHLREATFGELEEARRIALGMIEKYLKYLGELGLGKKP